MILPEGGPEPPVPRCFQHTAYRSAENERYLAGIGRVSRIHRRKPPGRPMPRHTARANRATVTLANMAYNMKRWCWLDRRSLPA